MARSRVSGVKETANNIRKLSYVGPLVSRVAKEVMKPIEQDAKANLRTFKPHRYIPGPNVVTTELLRSIITREVMKRVGRSVTAVGASGKGIAKAHLVEFGTDPHYQPRRKVWHPGAKPFPYLTPAFVKHERHLIPEFEARVFAEIAAKARALGGRVA